MPYTLLPFTAPFCSSKSTTKQPAPSHSPSVSLFPLKGEIEVYLLASLFHPLSDGLTLSYSYPLLPPHIYQFQVLVLKQYSVC